MQKLSGNPDSHTIPYRQTMFQFPVQYVPPNHKHAAPRRKFTQEEDLRLRSLVDQIGAKSWEAVAKFMPNRSARQCRDRYKNYLLDNLVCDAWVPEEDAVIFEKFKEIGPKWVEISKFLNGRSGNHVKNRWHKHLSKMANVPQPPAQAHFPMPPEPVQPQRTFPPPTNPMQQVMADRERPIFGQYDPSVSSDPGTFRGFSYGPSLF
jgi:hypothetical protein